MMVIKNMNEKTICFVCLRDRGGHPDLAFQDADLCADCGDSNAFMIGQMMADEGFTKYANPYSGSGLDVTTIGARKRSTESNYFDGQIADVRIYNRALSAAEVRALYPTTYGLTKDAERWDNGWEYGKHKQL